LNISWLYQLKKNINDVSYLNFKHYISIIRESLPKVIVGCCIPGTEKSLDNPKYFQNTLLRGNNISKWIFRDVKRLTQDFFIFLIFLFWFMKLEKFRFTGKMVQAHLGNRY